MLTFELLHPRMTHEALGLIPEFLSHNDTRPAAEQINTNYAHGGGWSPMRGWEMEGDCIRYPGDSLLHPLAKAKLRDEEIFLYESAWLAIRQPDGSFEVSRVD
jgi:hypothetical protein